MRNTKVGTSDNIVLLSPLANETLIRSMVKLSWPFSSVLETILGIYLELADLEWKGADNSEADAAEDIFSLNNNSGTVYIILL